MIRIKPIVFTVICFAAYQFCYPQDKKIDSLRNEMNAHPNKDTTRVKKILSYGLALFSEDREKAIQLSKEALKLAQDLGWNKGTIRGLQNLSLMAARNEFYDESISYSLDALKISEDNGDNGSIIQCHLNLSDIYRLTGDTSHSFFHAEKGLELARLHRDESLIRKAIVMTIFSYMDHDKKDKAMALLPEAQERANLAGDESVQYELLDVKARILAEQKDYVRAIMILKNLVPYYQRTGRQDIVAFYYCELSHNYTLSNKKDSAFFYGQQALDLSKKHELKKELNDANFAMYNYYYRFGDFKKALEFKIAYDSIYRETYSWAAAQNTERTRIQLAQAKKDAIAEKEKFEKDARARQARTLQLIAIVFLLLIAAFLLVNNRQKQRSKARIEKAYSDLKSTQQQLIQSEKMASLGELTAGIAHEIQNPLNFVNNFSEVNDELLKELKAEAGKGNLEEVKAIANDIAFNSEKINHHGKRADSIVKGMLQHSRTTSGQKEPTDINALADEYLRLAYHGLRAKDKSFNANTKTDFDNSIGKINVVPQEIGRVILNLINNAFYAVSEKQKENLNGYEPVVTVSTRTVKSPLGDLGVEIRVRDNGNGIPQKILDKIYQPFFTTKPTGQGTGLGLSLSYDIIKAHGGEIKVETKEGEGSDFIIQLPKN